MTERVIAVVAHPDDEVLGCGATLAKHVEAGDEVSIMILADGTSSRLHAQSLKEIAARQECAHKAAAILGVTDVVLLNYADNRMDAQTLINIVQVVEEYIDRRRPTIVYTHHAGDLNVDHRVTHDAVRVACRPRPGCPVKRILYFEVPCSTAWAGDFAPTYFEDVTGTIGAKTLALAEYPTEICEWPHPRSYAGIANLAAYRGASVGLPAAEAFMVGRIVA